VIKALEVESKPYLFLLNIFCVQIILHNTTPFPSKQIGAVAGESNGFWFKVKN